MGDGGEAYEPDANFGTRMPASALWRLVVEVRAARDLLPASGKLKPGEAASLHVGLWLLMGEMVCFGTAARPVSVMRLEMPLSHPWLFQDRA